MRTYRHTQIGWLIIAVTAALAVVFVLTNPALTHTAPGRYGLGIFPLLLLLFGTLTVTVEGGLLRARFGIGLIGKSVALSDVQAVAVVKNSWLIGWGIRWYPGGTLYNVSGLHAVELRLRSGRSVRIGSDQPHALAAALHHWVRERDTAGEIGPAASSHKLGIVPRVVLGAVAVGLLVLVGFVVCLTLLEPKPPKVTLTADALKVKSFAYGVDVPLRDITAVSVEERLPCILRRTNGFSAAGCLRGHFDVQGLGRGMLFVDVGSPPFLLVRRTSGFVIVGLEDPERTRALATEIEAAWARVR